MPPSKPYQLRYRPQQALWSVAGPDGPVGILPIRHAARLASHLNRAFGLGAEWVVKKRARKMQNDT